jgi:hypothetical protein
MKTPKIPKNPEDRYLIEYWYVSPDGVYVTKRAIGYSSLYSSWLDTTSSRPESLELAWHHVSQWDWSSYYATRQQAVKVALKIIRGRLKHHEKETLMLQQTQLRLSFLLDQEPVDHENSQTP